MKDREADFIGRQRLAKLRLTYPPTFSESDVQALFESYARSNPSELNAWRNIERDYKSESKAALRDIQNRVTEFLMANTEWDNLSSLTSAWMAIRKKVVDSVKLH
jgi:hypothetical protein